jgi:hypothetical protein
MFISIYIKMGGGMLNLTSKGNECSYLTGNPTKTFFKTAYAKYTNFGLQKFRIDFTGQRTLDLNKPSVFDFKIPRYGDLLMDTYLTMTIPHIWSPILPPTTCPSGTTQTVDNIWKPYEFKWIKQLGSSMIKNIRFLVGGQVIQEFTGDYLQLAVGRDFDRCKQDLYNRMTGNTEELNDPANSFNRVNTYPNVWPNTSDKYNTLGPEPSIRGRKIYVPLNIWFTLAAKMAFPLVSLQYNEMHIEVTMRPIKELFVIRDIDRIIPPYSSSKGATVGNYIQPNFNNPLHQFYRFLQPPPFNSDTSIQDITKPDFYPIQRSDWNSDIHLISTYVFLSTDEMRIFAAKPQSYLVKQVYQTLTHNVVNSRKVKLQTSGCVANMMWVFRRSDVNLRNEWSNYTNWPYSFLPYNVVDPLDYVSVLSIDNSFPQIALSDEAEHGGDHKQLGLVIDISDNNLDGYFTIAYNPPQDCSGDMNIDYKTNHKMTGNYSEGNQRDIMNTWGLLVDGKYRENTFDAGVFNYVEKYVRTAGDSIDGVYCYNFGLGTKASCFQPSGAMNFSKFRNVEIEFTTYTPPADPNAETLNVCDEDANFIGINKAHWEMYLYTYDITIVEERYNILTISNGNAALSYTR